MDSMELKWLNESLHTHGATDDSSSKTTKHRVYHEDEGLTAIAGDCVYEEHRRRFFSMGP